MQKNLLHADCSRQSTFAKTAQVGVGSPRGWCFVTARYSVGLGGPVAREGPLFGRARCLGGPVAWEDLREGPLLGRAPAWEGPLLGRAKLLLSRSPLRRRWHGRVRLGGSLALPCAAREGPLPGGPVAGGPREAAWEGEAPAEPVAASGGDGTAAFGSAGASPSRVLPGRARCREGEAPAEPVAASGGDGTAVFGSVGASPSPCVAREGPLPGRARSPGGPVAGKTPWRDRCLGGRSSC